MSSSTSHWGLPALSSSAGVPCQRGGAPSCARARSALGGRGRRSGPRAPPARRPPLCPRPGSPPSCQTWSLAAVGGRRERKSRRRGKVQPGVFKARNEGGGFACRTAAERARCAPFQVVHELAEHPSDSAQQARVVVAPAYLCPLSLPQEQSRHFLLISTEVPWMILLSCVSER